MVADHLVMSVSEGKAERPGVGEVMRVMSSDWRLRGASVVLLLMVCVCGGLEVLYSFRETAPTYRLTTFPLLAGRA